MADRVHFRRAVHNINENCNKNTARGQCGCGGCHYAEQYRQRRMRVEIADNSTGVAPDDFEKSSSVFIAAKSKVRRWFGSGWVLPSHINFN